MSALDVVTRPFAAFFEEAFVSCIDAVDRPCPTAVGTARVPSDVDDTLRLNLCCECLRPKDECCCD